MKVVCLFLLVAMASSTTAMPSNQDKQFIHFPKLDEILGAIGGILPTTPKPQIPKLPEITFPGQPNLPDLPQLPQCPSFSINDITKIIQEVLENRVSTRDQILCEQRNFEILGVKVNLSLCSLLCAIRKNGSGNCVNSSCICS